MKLLWVKTDFLHPTTRGGQIRSLELLRRLHAKHEVHYVAFHDGQQTEALERSSEYCSHHYPIPHQVPPRSSPWFALQLAAGLISPLPLAVSRYRSPAMRRRIAELTQRVRFDAVVCDFPMVALNIPNLAGCVLFQHNVEYQIWRRHAEHAPTLLHRGYFRLQTERMFAFERSVCTTVKRVIAVSDADAQRMREEFGVREVVVTPTGVDAVFFARPLNFPPPSRDLVFVGSMDWMPNEDGVLWFVQEVLPRIRSRHPRCTLTITGRKPSSAVQDLARTDPYIQVTGTVDDVRPWLWSSRIAIVPLRIGGGTRLKIYEAMAAGVPVVSTPVGAEGLDVQPGENILFGSNAEQFAEACSTLLAHPDLRQELARKAVALVTERYSWDVVARQFGEFLQ